MKMISKKDLSFAISRPIMQVLKSRVSSGLPLSLLDSLCASLVEAISDPLNELCIQQTKDLIARIETQEGLLQFYTKDKEHLQGRLLLQKSRNLELMSMYTTAKYQQIEEGRKGLDRDSIQVASQHQSIERALSKSKGKRFLGDLLNDVTYQGSVSSRDVKRGASPEIVIMVEEHENHAKDQKKNTNTKDPRYQKVATESEINSPDYINKRNFNPVSADPRKRPREEKRRDSFIFKSFKDENADPLLQSAKKPVPTENRIVSGIADKPSFNLQYKSKIEDLEAQNAIKMPKTSKKNPFTHLGMLLSTEDRKEQDTTVKIPTAITGDPLPNLLHKGILGVDHHLDYRKFGCDYMKLT